MTAILENLCPSHIVLSGGVGGAKLVRGLSASLQADDLMIIGNIGDDFEHWGLHISPDLDTLLYTLSEVVNSETGWGRAGDSWMVLEEISRLGRDAWFRLGDRDLAVHIERTHRLRSGESLSQVTLKLCREFGLDYVILPPTDDPIRTLVSTKEAGDLDFQDYFVRQQCRPVVTGLCYQGAEGACLLPTIESALLSSNLRSVIIGPSNPFLSIAPILAITTFRDLLIKRSFPCVVVSPMIGLNAFKGPTAKIMRELGYEVSSFTVASYYSSNTIDGIIIDSTDSDLITRIEDLGIKTLTTDIAMHSLEDKVRLANQAIEFAGSLG